MPNLPSDVEGIAWCIAFMLEAVYIVLGNFRTLILFAVKRGFAKEVCFWSLIVTLTLRLSSQ